MVDKGELKTDQRKGSNQKENLSASVLFTFITKLEHMTNMLKNGI
jgi:hypothetical protein